MSHDPTDAERAADLESGAIPQTTPETTTETTRDAASSPHDYQVGYRKPPKHTQWKKGQSGNARGRLKGSKGFKQDRDAMLKQPVALANGAVMTTQQAAMATLRAKALKGDARALDRIVEFAAQAQAERDAAPAQVDQTELSTADQKIIDDYIARRSPSGVATPTPPRPPAPSITPTEDADPA